MAPGLDLAWFHSNQAGRPKLAHQLPSRSLGAAGKIIKPIVYRLFWILNTSMACSFKNLLFAALVIMVIGLSFEHAWADKGSGGGNSGSGNSGSGSGNSGHGSGNDDDDDENEYEDHDQDYAKSAVEQGNAAPLWQLKIYLRENYPGKIINVNLQRRAGRYIYRVKILSSSGRLSTIRLDAITFQLVKL